MISQTLHALERGIKVMRSNTRLLLVGVLVFVFPLLFVWITQSFFSTAYSNIDTSEKQRVSMLQESFAEVIESASNYPEVTQNLITSYAQQNSDITKIRVVEIRDDEVEILYALNTNLEGTFEQSQELYRSLPGLNTNSSVIYPTVINGARTWQVFRGVSREDRDFVIFTEHSFRVVDSVMTARQQQSYIGLTVIFLFLIALAYWLNTQVYWEKKHSLLTNDLKDREMFSNMIAHEFRAPVTVIKGYASFLEESSSIPAEEKRYATNIRVSSERLVVLVNDFLEVARLQSGKLKVDKRSVDIREVISQVSQDLSQMAQQKGLQIETKLPSQSVPLYTDQMRMIQIVTNIVSNSIKYTEKGSIELTCKATNQFVEIVVQDTGTGISAADQKKLFQPFTRVGGVDNTTISGSGLGMWITQKMVELLGGSIEVESIRGVGTRIIVHFKV